MASFTDHFDMLTVDIVHLTAQGGISIPPSRLSLVKRLPQSLQPLEQSHSLSTTTMEICNYPAADDPAVCVPSCFTDSTATGRLQARRYHLHQHETEMPERYSAPLSESTGLKLLEISM
jgi:hypothetical protein